MKMTGPYWVYLHITPDGMIYVGRSGMTYNSERWNPNNYKNSLEPHIKKWGWENIRHFFIDGLSKEESYRLEDELIRMYKEKGICINKQCSGGLLCDGKKKEYYEKHKEEIKEYYEQHKDEFKEYQKEYYKQHKDELKEYQKEYYKQHKEELDEYYRKHRKERNEYLKEYRRRKKLLTKTQPDGCISLW